MDTRSAGIVPSSSPLWDVEGVPVAVPHREAPAGPGGGQPAGCSAWLGITVRLRSERVFGFRRNRCSASIGTPARLPSESAFYAKTTALVPAPASRVGQALGDQRALLI